jgi:glycerophosphoryl diester phosphodiesterase
MEVVGHGGAGDFFPGNSLSSIQKALEIGVDRIEVDVQVAANRRLVLVHDDEVKIDGRHERVKNLSVDRLRGALDGLLTLEEAIELIRGNARLMVDMKSSGYEAEVADCVNRAGVAGETIVSSTYAWSLRRVKHAAPDVAIGLSTGHISTVMRRNTLVRLTSGVLAAITPLPLVTTAKWIGANYLMLNYRICTRRAVRRAHGAGLGVYAWTVNHPKPMRRLIGDGVDGIISNRPDLVNELLGRSQTPVPIDPVA